MNKKTKTVAALQFWSNIFFSPKVSLLVCQRDNVSEEFEMKPIKEFQDSF